MLAYFRVPIGWLELLKRALRETLEDDAQGLAAQLAYYFFLSLFPALLALLAFASLFPLQHLTDDVVRLLSPIAPADVVTIIQTELVRLGDRNSGGLLSLGLLGAIWTSSSAMGAVVNAMNRAYDLVERRPWWKVRVAAMILTIGLAFFILLSLTLVVAGPQLADFLAQRFGLSAAVAWLWKVGQWPLILALVSTAIGLIYYFAPDADQDWIWVTPGSFLAAFIWMIGSLGFRAYVVNFGDYEATYGTVGGVIVLLLWFYLTGLVIVIGAELNVEIERASPWGRTHRQYSATGRRCIGSMAERMYTEQCETKPGGDPIPKASGVAVRSTGP